MVRLSALLKEEYIRLQEFHPLRRESTAEDFQLTIKLAT
jgi:hypothetical protein